jgi:predicted dehydrogenase
VIIATPPEHHARNCESAISFGRAVLVEKPFTLNLKDAIRIVELAEQAHTPLVVGQNYRYLRWVRTCRRVVREGLLGRIGIVTLQYYRVPHEMAKWLTRSEYNVLWGMAVHHLDALRFMLQQEVRGVMAESFCLPWSQAADGASLQLLLKFDGDTHGTYAASYESSGHEFFERGQEFYARLVGELGTLHVFQRWLVLCPSGKLPRLVRRGPRSFTEEAVLLRQLKEAVSSGQEPESSGRDNLQTMAIVEACVQSATQHCWKDPQELLGNSQ